MYKIITLTLSIIITLFLIKSTLRISSEFSDPIPINGLEPPPSTHYGGIILDSGTEYSKDGSFEKEISLLLESKKYVSLEDIKKIKTPFIALTKDNYFLIVEEFGETCDEDKILVFDPRYGKVLLKNNYFRKICNNFILTIGE